jgi:hypothetical protein
VGSIAAGEPFGISAFVEQYRLMATGMAHGPVQAIAIDAASLRALRELNCHQGYTVMHQIARALAERLGFALVELAAFGSIDVAHPRVGTMRHWNVVLEAAKPGEITILDRGKVDGEAFESAMIFTFSPHEPKRCMRGLLRMRRKCTASRRCRRRWLRRCAG